MRSTVKSTVKEGEKLSFLWVLSLSRRYAGHPAAPCFFDRGETWTNLLAKVTSRAKPASPGRKRSITFPNDHHPSYSTVLMLGARFHSPFGRGGSYQCMSGQPTILGRRDARSGDFVRRCAAILSPPCHQREGQGSVAFAASLSVVKIHGQGSTELAICQIGAIICQLVVKEEAGSSLAATPRRAATADGEHQKRTSGHDVNWPDW
jgi:hypothetical protein